MVAASILLLALTQLQFSVSVGDSAFSWGMDANRDVPEMPAQVEPNLTATSLIKRVEVLEQAASEMGSAVEALALQDTRLAESFKQNTLELAHYQRVESQARLRDMQQLMRWTDYPEAHDVKLASDTASLIERR